MPQRERESYQNGEDVIKALQSFHERLSAFYGVLHGRIEEERGKLLLDYLRTRTREVGDLLTCHDDDSTRKLRETWFQFVPLVDLPDPEEIAPETPVEDLISLTLDLEGQLLSTYETLAATTPTEEVQEFFGALHDAAAQRRENLVRDVNAFRDS